MTTELRELAREVARNGHDGDVVGELVRLARQAGHTLSHADAMALIAEADNGPANTTATRPLFDVQAAKFARFFESKPAEREWVIRNALPCGVAGIVAAMGGVGKSMAIFQLGISVVTGLPFMGLAMGDPGGFLYLAAEDDEPELHRRGLRLLKHYQDIGEYVNTAAVAERLHIVSRVARDNLLTRSFTDGDVRRTALVDQIIAAAQQIPDLRVIALDPLSRFRGGRANHEEDATRYVEAVEAIREATGATVISVAHVNQTGAKEGGGQEIVRGSTALVDGVRWVATLQRLRRDQADSYGVRKDEADRYLRLEIPKSNYAPPFKGLWLRREAGGALVPTELEERTNGTREAKVQAKYIETVERIQTLLRENGPLTQNQLETRHAGELGPIGVGRNVLRQVINRALQAGDLVNTTRIGSGGGRAIGIPGGAA